MDRKATIFEFTSYQFEPEKKRVVFNYKTEFETGEPVVFTEAILLPSVPKLENIPEKLLQKLLEGLHLVLGISYYKFYCPSIVRHNYELTKSQAEFWNTVYKNGLGEFFYKNKLDPKISPKFSHVSSLRGGSEATDEAISTTAKSTDSGLPRLALRGGLAMTSVGECDDGDKCLVGVSGGKDSIVAAELLKQGKFNATAFYVETNKESELVNKVIETTGLPQLKIQRFLDWQVFQSHKYNGHIPISAIYAFLGLFAAVLYDYKYFIVANEYSSNFGNIKYKGQTINHQWSKSFEFEEMFQDYVRTHVTPHVTYFSLLRPFYEIRIAQMFSKYEKYFPYFSSCNKNFRLARQAEAGQSVGWCCSCAKCIFAFILLSAFLPKEKLLNIFGKNLYQDDSLLPLFKDVLGFGKMKPFDCVGTFEEAQTAFNLGAKKFKNDFIVKTLLNNSREWFNDKNVLRTQGESSIPEQFRFLGMKSVLILGYGKEGKVTKKYLQKFYPNLKVGIADASQGKNYLEKQKNFDIAIKTPGMKKELVKIPYTTATNIFFSKVLSKNLIIGVTGSKGKSTTSTLIYEILKAGGKDVVLLGNIGKPMLEFLLEPVNENTIFVLELSSYQLQDLKVSPDIAVVTNLFPEHMDFHNGLKNYYSAKKNIINFQNKNNYFVYNPQNKKVGDWLKNYCGKAVLFDEKIEFETSLLGQHNQQNIKVAISVAKILGINDEIIKSAIKNFSGLPHRLEFAGEFKGIKFYDDAISTTPESTIRAIQALKNVGTIFLGGQDRGYNFSQLEKIIKKYKIRNIVLFPDSGNKILKSTAGLKILKTKSMEKAIEFAFKNTEKGKICLLSCASPSYSLWKDFEQKGDQFKKFVKKFGK